MVIYCIRLCIIAICISCICIARCILIKNNKNIIKLIVLMTLFLMLQVIGMFLNSVNINRDIVIILNLLNYYITFSLLVQLIHK